MLAKLRLRWLAAILSPILHAALEEGPVVCRTCSWWVHETAVETASDASELLPLHMVTDSTGLTSAALTGAQIWSLGWQRCSFAIILPSMLQLSCCMSVGALLFSPAQLCTVLQPACMLEALQ